MRYCRLVENLIHSKYPKELGTNLLLQDKIFKGIYFMVYKNYNRDDETRILLSASCLI